MLLYLLKQQSRPSRLQEFKHGELLKPTSGGPWCNPPSASYQVVQEKPNFILNPISLSLESSASSSGKIIGTGPNHLPNSPGKAPNPWEQFDAQIFHKTPSKCSLSRSSCSKSKHRGSLEESSSIHTLLVHSIKPSVTIYPAPSKPSNVFLI
ncbi:hypothetical protein Droror1_Dr00012094 [Drosera rotundifolia]